MPRLFITPREVDFISDITKELVKDVRGQKIFYYRVREDLTEVHDVYEEAPEKIFNPPIEIEAGVEWQPEEVRTNRYGSEEISTISVYLQSRDLLDRDITVREGDYFSYGGLFFEITSVLVDSQVYGQVEHAVGIKIAGKQARKGQIDFNPNGPTSEADTEEGSVQEEFEQQRGFAENTAGETGDVRQLVKDGKLDPPLSHPNKIRKSGDDISSSFYGDE